ncbi:MAG: tetratricopeptide repeat protein [Alphaproteobacteria bacterium]|nr:tetratricopeptide repeat protein [Alphaproteobacteria bacterium]
MTRQIEAAERYAEAVAHHQAGRLAEAERLYRAILAADPRHAFALHHLGVIAHQAGHHDAARRLIEDALALVPDFPEALTNLGLALLALGRHDEAVARLDRAVSIAPDDARALYNLGVAFDAAGNVAGAAVAYRRAVDLKPDYVQAQGNLAIALHATGRLPQAVAAYRRAIELAPARPRFHTYLGLALAADGAPAEALASYRHSLALAPGDPITHNCLAEALYQTGDIPGAVAAQRDALRRLAEAGALAPPWAAEPAPNYPLGMYPDALRAVMRCLDAAGIDAFLIGGTLIGAMRDGDFIGYDKDLDFGIGETVGAERLSQALAADPDFALSGRNGTDPGGSEPALLGYWWRNKVAIDFFRFWREADALCCGLSVDGRMLKWVHRAFALADFTWHGVTVRIPDDADRFLTECYGDWRTPNPHYGLFASPNLDGGFSALRQNLAFGAIYRALLQRKKAKVQSLCEQVLALDPDDTLIADMRARLAAASPHGTAGMALAAQSQAEALVMAPVGGRLDRLPG